MNDSSADRSGILSEVRNYILSEFLPDEDPASLENTTPLISAGILDSIATAKLVSHLEERFDIRFKAHEVGAQKLDTVEKIVDAVEEKLNG